MGARRGTSLVEVMVALTLVAVALLALAAATAALARHRRDARRAALAAQVAAERAARTAACLDDADGERAVGALRERWVVTRAHGVRTVRTTVEQPAAGRRWTFAASGLCAEP